MIAALASSQPEIRFVAARALEEARACSCRLTRGPERVATRDLLKDDAAAALGARHLLTGAEETSSYRTGFRFGAGKCLAVARPGSLVRAVIAYLVGIEMGLAEQSARAMACGIEYLHTASLIFDDLPAMDDARMRRGAACAHVVHGEAVAIGMVLAHRFSARLGLAPGVDEDAPDQPGRVGALVVSPDGKSVTVTLPTPTLQKPTIDSARSHVASRKRGLFNRIGGIRHFRISAHLHNALPDYEALAEALDRFLDFAIAMMRLPLRPFGG